MEIIAIQDFTSPGLGTVKKGKKLEVADRRGKILIGSGFAMTLKRFLKIQKEANMEFKFALLKNSKDITQKKIIILGQGPSVKILEENILKFKGKDVIWASLNRFHLIEKNILSQIDEEFSIIWCSALKRFDEMYDYLKIAGENGTLLMSKTAVIKKFTFPSRKYCCDFGTGFSSIFAMLCTLINIVARDIYLIGFDGCAKDISNVYYSQQQMNDNHQTRMMSIAKDTKMMNKIFWDYVAYALNVEKKFISIKVLSGSALTCFDQVQLSVIRSELGDKKHA